MTGMKNIKKLKLRSYKQRLAGCYRSALKEYLNMAKLLRSEIKTLEQEIKEEKENGK